jgi:hypothetical protein
MSPAIDSSARAWPRLGFGMATVAW